MHFRLSLFREWSLFTAWGAVEFRKLLALKTCPPVNNHALRICPPLRTCEVKSFLPQQPYIIICTSTLWSFIGKHILTGYKIKDDGKFLGTFIMSFNALVTYLFGYYYMYYSVRLTGNTINPSFIIYFTSRKVGSFNNLHYTLHLSWNNQ